MNAREAYIFQMSRISVKARETTIRHMLEQWASELEPAVVVSRDGRVLGLCVEDDPTGFLLVRAH